MKVVKSRGKLASESFPMNSCSAALLSVAAETN